MKSRKSLLIGVVFFLFTNLYLLISIPVVARTSPTSSLTPRERQQTNPLLDFLTIFLNMGYNISNSPSSATNPPGGYGTSRRTGTTGTTSPGGLVYYSQCNGGYDSTSLPGGCNLCKAGCGPTTVAMIVASYVNKNTNPATIVDLYRKNNFYLGCDGSRYSDARTALSQFGLRTTDYLIYSGKNIRETANDFRGYIKSGWTLFALANYCDGGCGHFFWIIDIDEKNNVWAYDPFYGRKQAPPLNESIYDPFPRYRVVFGVRNNVL